MGLYANLYRSGYDSEANMFYGHKVVTIVNVEGPSDPSPHAPPAMLLQHNCFEDDVGRRMVIVVPAEFVDGKYQPLPKWQRQFGGTYCSTCDSRLSAEINKMLGVEFYGALAVHDRIER